MNEPPQVQVQQAKGLNTFAARGSTDQPRILRNAVLRPGGWACAPKARPVVQSITAALYAGRRADLFLQTPAGLLSYVPTQGAPVPIPNSTGRALSDGTALGPGLVFFGDAYLHASFGLRSVLKGATFTEWDGTGTAPSTPWFRRIRVDNPAYAHFDFRETYTIRLVPLRGPTAPAPSPYDGPTEITLTAQPGQYQGSPTTARYTVQLGGMTWGFNLYHDGSLPGTPRPAQPKFFASTESFTSAQGYTYVIPTNGGGAPGETSIGYVKARVAEYHIGRIWAAGSSWFYDPENPTPVSFTDASPSRLFYSDTVVEFSPTVLPFWAEDFYFDIPFKSSSRIVALQSAGRYLYVFGDREVMLLSGSDDLTWTIESVGDSIGAIVASSVQRLQTVAIYLSDSGVLLLQGGQTTDISGDVRDLLLNLNRENITTTVDFAQEQYLITDGVTTLVYHLREQGWTQRDMDGPAQRLIYGGGTPYSLHGGNLHVLDSPELLPMTLTVGPFGQPGVRRQWRGVTFAVDTDQTASVSARLDGRDVNEDLQPVEYSGTPQERTATNGLTPVVMSLGADGISMSHAQVELTITVTPSSTARRCLLRPPITLPGKPVGEAFA